MSLQLWLPLNRDLHNQGLYNTTFINNGATVNNSGKIGKCYSFNGSNNYLMADFTPGTLIPNEMSFCCWVKFNSFSGNTHTLFCSRKTVGAGISIFVLQDGVDGARQLRFDNGNNTDIATNKTFFNYIFSPNTWYHITLVQTKTQRQLYINGILQQSINKASGNQGANTATKCFIGGSTSNDTAGVISNWFNGYLNDIRIYNHALSDKEIEEISKGLVLHYKLDGISLPANNLLADSLKDAGKSHTTYNIADFNFLTSLNTDNYTIIAKINTSVEKKSIGFYHSGGSWIMGTWQPINEDKIYIVHFTANSNMANSTSGLGHGFCRVYVSNNENDIQGSTPLSGTANVEWIKIYLGSGDRAAFTLGETPTNLCIDSSGYNYNGTIVGNLATTTNDVRYKSATWFNGSSYIAIGTQLYNMRDEMTVSIWVKKTWGSNKGTPFSSVQSGGFGWQVSSTNYTFYCGTGASSNTYISKALTTNNLSEGWHMLSATYNGLALKLYIDGVLKSTTSKYSTKTPLYYNSASGMFVGGESAGAVNTTSTDRFTGSLSDLRIYATALTDNQIKELYNTSMSVDNQGNIYIRELVE